MANMSDQGYQEISSSLCFASLPYFQQHPQPVQSMQIQSHSHHARILAPPYQHLLSSMQPNNPNSSSNSLLSGSRFLFFPSNAEQVYRPSWQLVQATPEVSHENIRILTSEVSLSFHFCFLLFGTWLTWPKIHMDSSSY